MVQCHLFFICFLFLSNKCVLHTWMFICIISWRHKADLWILLKCECKAPCGCSWPCLPSFWLTHESWKSFLSCSLSLPLSFFLLGQLAELQYMVYVGFKISYRNREAEVVFLTCWDLSISFSVVSFFHLLFPGFVALSLTLQTCLCAGLWHLYFLTSGDGCSAQKWHTDGTDFIFLADFYLIYLASVCFRTAVFFPVHAVFEQTLNLESKTGLSAIYPAFPNLSGLQ